MGRRTNNRKTTFMVLIDKSNFELCKEVPKEEEININNYYCEVKFDGERAFMFIKKGYITRLLNRRGYDNLSKYSNLKEIKVPCKSAVIDGEIVILNRIKTSLFELARKENWNKTTFIAFDLIELNGEDLREKPIEYRKNKLYELLLGLPFKQILYSSNYSYSSLWNIVINNNLEGVVLKKKESKYLGYRSGNWLKRKYKKDITLEFNKYEEHIAGITLYSTNKHKTRVACLGEQSKKVKEKLDKNKKIKAEISYLYLTDNGNYYQPTFKRLK